MRCKLEGRPLYRSAVESMKTRQEKKLTGSKDWYRSRKRKLADRIGQEDGEDWPPGLVRDWPG